MQINPSDRGGTVANTTKQSEDYLSAFADELEISDSRYRDAERSYNSLGAWLNREDSSIRAYRPVVYVQGSFRLGTAIKPVNDEDEYDVDAVCELRGLTKDSLSQATLKRKVWTELEAYRRSKTMVKPLREGRRCWTLDYADGAQFHMDIVPALSNGVEQRFLLEKHGHDRRYAQSAIVITDNEDPYYELVSPHWPRSNPKGYADWFRSRMATPFEKRRRLLAETHRKRVEDIPDYQVRTPLQSAIIILKRHRDMMFSGRKETRPISIILTTLAAHSYEGEETVPDALFAILSKMDSFIQYDSFGNALIPNPTDPLENFADKWVIHPERGKAFEVWLKQAREDFGRIASLGNLAVIQEALQDRIGHALAKRATERIGSPGRLLRAASVAPATAAPQTPTFGNQARTPSRPAGFA